MDDVEGILKNPNVVDVSVAISSLHLKSIVYSLIYQEFGDYPLPYHLVSIFLHVVNTTLVFFLIKILLNRKTAVLSSLLFLVHPANSEAVSWLSGSVYLYQALFWLVSIYAFVLFRRTKNIAFLVFSILLYIAYFIFVGGVWGVVLPFVILSLDLFVINKKYDLKSVLPVIAFFIVTLIYLILNFTRQYELRSEDLENYYVGLTAENRVVSMMRAVDRSAKLFLVPYRLDILFGNFSRSAINYLGLLAITGMVIYLFYYFYNKDRSLFGLLACVYLSVLPIFSPVSIGLGFAERYFYFSSVFFCTLFISWILTSHKKLGVSKVFVPILIFVLILFSFRTFIRTLDWKDDETIWRASLAVNSNNNYKAYNELGNIYYRNDELREALINYQKALEIRPLYPEVLHNVGLVYIKAGQLDNAKLFMQRSLELNPTMYQSYYRLGQIYAYEGKTDVARNYILKALEIKPDHTPSRNELDKLN